MSSLSTMTVESKIIHPTRLTYSISKAFDALSGTSTGTIAGSVTIEFDLEEETDDNTFFAMWFFEKKTKLVTIDVTTPDQPQKFLTLEMLDAQIVGYQLLQDQHIPDSQQNGFVTITLAAPTISVGQAPFAMGE